jgi:uncharacterized alpha-E superfamily protein
MARSVERAENAARLLDVTVKSQLLPGQKSGRDLARTTPWEVPLTTSGQIEPFLALYPKMTADHVLEYMVTRADNPSSILGCLHLARENARTVRGAITSEMWECINSIWLELRDVKAKSLHLDRISDLLERVKMQSHLFRGITVGTALQDEAWQFIRLGTFLERADNTARILDVKYHILLPSLDEVGGARDYYQWGALLRSVSAFEAYRKIYRDVISPQKVAELLILRADLPRSLHACMNEIQTIMEALPTSTAGEARRQAGEIHSRLHYGRIGDIIKGGLHEYLTWFVETVNELGDEINQNYFAMG